MIEDDAAYNVPNIDQTEKITKKSPSFHPSSASKFIKAWPLCRRDVLELAELLFFSWDHI
jgi:hypothetical protein